MSSFEINEDLLEALDEYHVRTMLMERHHIEKIPIIGDLETEVNDDLIFNVPIYDMGSRKYAAFCSFTEAVFKKENDVKGNGEHFSHVEITRDIDWFMLFYLFRLCGSGINYKPNTGFDFRGTHGFGNFWIVESLLSFKFKFEEWKEDLINLDKPFSNNKGYLLPQFSYKHLNKGHLKYFILNDSYRLVSKLLDFCSVERREIFQVTDYGNKCLVEMGYNRQNFVLTAFAADLAEYFPHLVDPKSRVYAGTNAVKCIKAIFPKKKGKRIKQFDYINDVLSFQADRYNLNPIDCEDSRNCDLVRYFQEYQSKDHIKANNGLEMKNNSILKKTWGHDKYYNFSDNLK